MYSFIRHNDILINKDFLDFMENNSLSDFQTLKDFKGGSLLKKNRFRSVVRIELGSRIFYLKRHFSPLKDRLISLVPRIKKEDAKNEWNNMIFLHSLGFNTMTPVAFGEKKRFGMPHFSLTLTENLYGAEKLELFFPKNFTPPLNSEKIKAKRAYIKKLAVLARNFHNKGLNHQDFYLGHILIRPEDDKLYIIDVQRMHQNIAVNMHDRIKDLSQIAYSATSLKIFTKSDLMRFILAYLDSDKLTHADKKLVNKIISKVKRIARHDAKLQLRKNIL